MTLGCHQDQQPLAAQVKKMPIDGKNPKAKSKRKVHQNKAHKTFLKVFKSWKVAATLRAKHQAATQGGSHKKLKGLLLKRSSPIIN